MLLNSRCYPNDVRFLKASHFILIPQSKDNKKRGKLKRYLFFSEASIGETVGFFKSPNLPSRKKTMRV